MTKQKENKKEGSKTDSKGVLHSGYTYCLHLFLRSNWVEA